MTTHRKWCGFLSLISLLALAAIPAPSHGKSAAYSIMSSAPSAGQKYFRVTARSKDGFTFDQEFFFSDDESDSEIAFHIFFELLAAGWDVDYFGERFEIFGHTSPISPITRIDVNDGDSLVVVRLEGDVEADEILPPNKSITFSCSAPNAHTIAPGSIVARINSMTATAVLLANDTPAQAAGRVHSALSNAGFVVTLSDATVSLDYTHPTNLALIGPTAHIEYELATGEDGPHLILGLPDSIRNIHVPVWNAWSASLTLLLLLSTAGFIIRRRQLGTAA